MPTEYTKIAQALSAMPLREEDTHAPLMALLVALDVVEIIYNLSGGDDSGECTLEQIRYADGRTDTRLPSIPVGFASDGEIRYLATTLEDIAADLPEGDWVNNEGGYGEVAIRPAETDPDLRYECNMTFRDEGDYGDDEDDDFDEVFGDIAPDEGTGGDIAFVVTGSDDEEVRP